MLRYVGLDVHKVWTQVAPHLPDGSIQRERIATSPHSNDRVLERQSRTRSRL